MYTVMLSILLFQILPGLQAFCISCAIAIAAIFILQTSWFVAFLVLDEIRIEERRNGFLPCLQHKEWTAPKWSQTGWTTHLMIRAANLYRFRLAQVKRLIQHLLYSKIVSPECVHRMHFFQVNLSWSIGGRSAHHPGFPGWRHLWFPSHRRQL
jgi:hypothetical protein